MPGSSGKPDTRLLLLGSPVNCPRKSALSPGCRAPGEEAEAPQPERGLQVVSGENAHGERLGVEQCDLWVPVFALS